MDVKLTAAVLSVGILAAVAAFLSFPACQHQFATAGEAVTSDYMRGQIRDEVIKKTRRLKLPTAEVEGRNVRVLDFSESPIHQGEYDVLFSVEGTPINGTAITNRCGVIDVVSSLEEDVSDRHRRLEDVWRAERRLNPFLPTFRN